MPAIELVNVTKTYGTQVAVDDLSLAVPEGCVYGFIGPNGSGKTTTLRMIMRIIAPDRGTITVLGDSSGLHGPANDRVGYLPEERSLYKQMKVREVLRFLAELKGHRPSRSEIQNWLERMGLPDVGEKKVEALSKGMSQKVQFIATIISKPQLVILDEPFSGLDPGNAEVLRDLVLDLRRKGTTVIFSTHDMSVAEEMCDFIFMINKGKKVLDGTLASIQQQHGTDVLHVRVASSNGSPPSLENLPGVLKVTDVGNWQELRVAPGSDRPGEFQSMAHHSRAARHARGDAHSNTRARAASLPLMRCGCRRRVEGESP
jgi:ABC-2 type transport system ATP-binding protein